MVNDSVLPPTVVSRMRRVTRVTAVGSMAIAMVSFLDWGLYLGGLISISPAQIGVTPDIGIGLFAGGCSL